MRHRVKGRKLSRTSAHRKSTMQSLTAALVKEHRIVTTVAKAKELRTFVEPLITRAKEDTNHNRRQVFRKLQNKETVKRLFADVGPKAKDRPGGYTRVIKAGFRKGDGAELAVIELVDYNDIKPEGTESTGKKRTRRAGKSNKPTSATPEPKKEEAEEVKATEAEETQEVAEEAQEETEETTAEESQEEETAEGSEEDTEEEEK